MRILVQKLVDYLSRIDFNIKAVFLSYDKEAD